MRSISLAFPAVAVLALLAPFAFAQPAPSAQPKPALPKAALPPASVVPTGAAKGPPPLPAPTTSSTAAPPLPAPSGSPDAPPKPPTIEVDDPLLEPVAPAAKSISGFKEVLSLLSN